MKQLINKIRAFNKARDWGKFHSPKNLSMAISIEAAELQELFLWISQKDSKSVKVKRVEQELADIMIFVIDMADQFDIDLEKAIYGKLFINETKYPVNLCKGSNKKYTELK